MFGVQTDKTLFLQTQAASFLLHTLKTQNKKKERTFETEEKKKKIKMGLGWIVNQQCRRWTTSRVCGATFLCCMCFILFTPTIPRSPKHHKFVDMRNLLGNHPHCARDHNFGVNFFRLLHSCSHDFGFSRSTQHVECDDEFPVLSCGDSGPCACPRRRCLQHKVLVPA